MATRLQKIIKAAEQAEQLLKDSQFNLCKTCVNCTKIEENFICKHHNIHCNELAIRYMPCKHMMKEYSLARLNET